MIDPIHYHKMGRYWSGEDPVTQIMSPASPLGR